MRIISLASGSKGNAYLVQAGETTVLVDAGLSGREIERRVQQAGLLMSDIELILLTHEHADHLRSAAILSKRFDLPVYGTEGTLGTPCGRIKAVAEATPRVEPMAAGDTLTAGSLTITSFSVSHDAADPVGYVFTANGHKAALACDIGQATRLVVQRLHGVNALILESNHCPTMLSDGPYPYWLKRRIAGAQGHLSNDDAGLLLRDVFHDDLRYLLLAHLSEVNNSPQAAFACMQQVLTDLSAEIDLRVGQQHRIGNWIDLDEETV